MKNNQNMKLISNMLYNEQNFMYTDSDSFSSRNLRYQSTTAEYIPHLPQRTNQFDYFQDEILESTSWTKNLNFLNLFFSFIEWITRTRYRTHFQYTSSRFLFCIKRDSRTFTNLLKIFRCMLRSIL